MRKSIEILVDEHKNILKIADAIEKECNELDKGKKINNDFFKEIIDFIRNYADKFHHAKEENILFKELCKKEIEGKMHCNPIEQMLIEHDRGRKFVKSIEQGMQERNRTKVIENARAYMQLIRDHISKEDNILYPMADQALNKKTQDNILKQFKKVEQEKKQDKEKYLAFVKNLESKNG